MQVYKLLYMVNVPLAMREWNPKQMNLNHAESVTELGPWVTTDRHPAGGAGSDHLGWRGSILSHTPRSTSGPQRDGPTSRRPRALQVPLFSGGGTSASESFFFLNVNRVRVFKVPADLQRTRVVERSPDVAEWRVKEYIRVALLCWLEDNKG